MEMGNGNATFYCQEFRIYDISEFGLYKFYYTAFFFIMILLQLYSVAMEIVEMYIFPYYYWKQYENWGQWIVNLTLLIVWVVSFIGANYYPGVFNFSKLEKSDDDDGSGEDGNLIRSIWEIFLQTIYCVSFYMYRVTFFIILIHFFIVLGGNDDFITLNSNPPVKIRTTRYL